MKDLWRHQSSVLIKRSCLWLVIISHQLWYVFFVVSVQRREKQKTAWTISTFTSTTHTHAFIHSHTQTQITQIYSSTVFLTFPLSYKTLFLNVLWNIILVYANIIGTLLLNVTFERSEHLKNFEMKHFRDKHSINDV